MGFSEHNGKRRILCTRTTDKAVVERIAGKHEADAAEQREGLIDPKGETFAIEARRTIAEHLADYRAKPEASGRSHRLH